MTQPKPYCSCCCQSDTAQTLVFLLLWHRQSLGVLAGVNVLWHSPSLGVLCWCQCVVTSPVVAGVNVTQPKPWCSCCCHTAQALVFLLLSHSLSRLAGVKAWWHGQRQCGSDSGWFLQKAATQSTVNSLKCRLVQHALRLLLGCGSGQQPGKDVEVSFLRSLVHHPGLLQQVLVQVTCERTRWS